MKFTSTLITVVTLFFHLGSCAQNASEIKIVGCWQFQKMELAAPPNKLFDQSNKETQNAVVCFDENGKFTTTKGGDNPKVIKGEYHLSHDGKSIYQKTVMEDEEKVGEIVLLTEEELQIKSGISTLYFKKK